MSRRAKLLRNRASGLAPAANALRIPRNTQLRVGGGASQRGAALRVGNNHRSNRHGGLHHGDGAALYHSRRHTAVPPQGVVRAFAETFLHLRARMALSSYL